MNQAVQEVGRGQVVVVVVGVVCKTPLVGQTKQEEEEEEEEEEEGVAAWPSESAS